MPSVPPVCPSCKGSGACFIWLPKPLGILPRYWYLHMKVGYDRICCYICGGYGTLEPDCLPNMDPKKWKHRKSPETTDQSTKKHQHDK